MAREDDVHEIVEGRHVADVHDMVRGVAAGFGDLPHDLPQLLLAARHAEDARPPARQRQREGAAQSGGGSRQERDFALE